MPAQIWLCGGSFCHRRRFLDCHSGPPPLKHTKRAPCCTLTWPVGARRLLEEEATKRTELEQIHLQQQRAIAQTQSEKQQLQDERLAKEAALEAAMEQLSQLESERQGALEQYQVGEPSS